MFNKSMAARPSRGRRAASSEPVIKTKLKGQSGPPTQSRLSKKSSSQAQDTRFVVQSEVKDKCSALQHALFDRGAVIEFLGILRFLGAPLLLLQILCLLAQTQKAPWLELLEVFAGEQAVTLAAQEAGRLSVGYEIRKCKDYMDFLGDRGFAYCLQLCLALVPCAQMMMAPVCSSFVWINRYTSKRSLLNPLGDQRKLYVAQANCMASRVVLMALIALAKGVLLFIEQPRGSLLEAHPRFQWFVKRHTLYRCSINMKSFGGETLKPTWLYCAHQCIQHFPAYGKYSGAETSKATVIRTVNSAGKVCVTGGPDLKSTQAYPRGFGLACNRFFCDFKGDIEADFKRLRGAALSSPKSKVKACDLFRQSAASTETWPDAKLQEVMDFIVQ
jgi:hypothetical protein